ncbi:MAG: SURF1 family protein [Natronospirillum sp.]|uniref:SURF1 family protein n=1 Tax=Natronospirillum sp. TaxID=2812955 RepID=UPI0025DF063A|nr:SURF1 family protein [Natronospirillum sp.]MCH8551727.1 SURF1 family protein [Natronospirillum sp.]
MTAFVLFFLPITLSLGWWQLNRAEEKKQVLAVLESRTNEAVEWISGVAPEAGFQIEACIDWSGELWYLDNRTWQGRVGYEVYLPATLCDTDEPLLLGLGWIEGLASRRELPAVSGLDSLAEPVAMQGEVRPRSAAPWLTAEAEAVAPRQWRLQSLADVPDERWGDGTPLIQLRTPDDAVLRDIWNPVNMPPERHIGYAVQWFGLASVLVLGFLAWGIKRGRTNTMRS